MIYGRRLTKIGNLFALLVLPICFAGCPQVSKNLNQSATEKSAGQPVQAATGDASRVREASAAVPRVLEDKFYLDGDGNRIPDFIETEFGFNPQADDCPYKDCGSGVPGEDLSPREQNTLLILDSSGSMASGKGAQNKMAAAKRAVERYVRTISAVQNLGFMVYGHRGNNSESGKQESCAGIELLAPIGGVSRDDFQNALARFEPTGWTPIAGALNKASEAFAGRESGSNRIILVSDGIETCGGDPVASAKELHEAGFKVRVDVVGFDVGKADAEQLRRIAEITGGEYADAKTGADLDEYLKKQIQAVYQTRAATTCEIGNLLHTPLCDQQMVNKALFYLDKLRQEVFKKQMLAQRDGDRQLAAQHEEIAAAYLDLIKQISASKDERDKKSREAVPRYRELDRKMNELGRQMREAYGNN